MSSIQNLKTFDPFADVGNEGADQSNTTANTSKSGYIHIRIQQRNGRKTLTTVQGLPEGLDFKKILKAVKTEFATNGNIVDDEELGKILQMQGDQRTKIAEFFVSNGIVKKNDIKIHGF
ncbi:eukaryotic translation initiation factor SUI1 [Conidiobolus coronatus NRRL 28638]|uniref:Eukaryotic translation initiation factor SUI1 n=1 Tax=Conidiobolus coronatus (strain ATCC 28846 / CBS 209.66 / NRRL 28638) TaxID=796925 RepID=A0A137PHI5_CONC2|nr:eukaryotic translation initiation factor SUI1 [Conidiobolus coronatus NRRL 28638]|eukprot:KXN74459.1 eukaryotic translation initiation factor SUI1 [Conidiobolus coronatus NRRL 28638]